MATELPVEDKTFKMRLATLISIIGGAISICLITTSYLSENTLKLEKINNKMDLFIQNNTNQIQRNDEAHKNFQREIDNINNRPR